MEDNKPQTLRRPRETNTTSRAIGYTRVSTDDQNAGLQVQREAIQAYCEREGLTLCELATDEGISGGTIRRPAIQSTLSKLASGEYGTLIVAKLDRLSRSILHFSQILDQSKREGWRLIILDAQIDTGTPAGKAMVGVLAVFAEFEREMICQRTKDALAVKRAQGVQLGRRKDLAPPAVVERIRAYPFENWEKLAERLNADGVPTTTGRGKWTGGSTKRLLERWPNNVRQMGETVGESSETLNIGCHESNT